MRGLVRVHLLDSRYEVNDIVEAEPRCGEDFCDDCGACLVCESGSSHDDCQGMHFWAIPAYQAAVFMERVS